MEYRGEDDAGDAEQGYAAVNGVYTCEQLAVECRDRVHRPMPESIIAALTNASIHDTCS